MYRRFFSSSKTFDTPTYLTNLEPVKMPDNLNVFPRTINRDCCDKNYQSNAQLHWNTLIVSQPGEGCVRHSDLTLYEFKSARTSYFCPA